MAAPSILNAGDSSGSADSTCYSVTGTRSSDSINISVPANANTVIICACIDKTQSSPDTDPFIDAALTFDSKTRICDVHLNPAQTTSLNYRRVRAAAFDVSGSGAIASGAVAISYSASHSDRLNLSVICTDGYVQELGIDNYNAGNGIYHETFNFNASNTGLLSISNWDSGSITFTATEGSEVFKALELSLRTYAIYQSANTNNVQAVEVTTSTTNDSAGILATLSTQPNPLADINPTGDIISHDIITN